MSHNVPWKSEQKPLNAGATFDLADFVPPKGPNGGRIIVDKYIACTIGVITVGTGTWDGRDVCRLLNTIAVEKRDARMRWFLSGFKSRQASIYFHGIERHIEHANVAVGAAQAIDHRLVIPMTKPFLPRGKDFGLAADTFKKITITGASLASAQTGTAVLSAPVLNVYVLAEWHEEMKLEFKCDDVIKSVDFNSNTQAKLSLTGVVHDLLIMRENSTAGGDVITAITDVRCEDLGTPMLTRQDLVTSYTIKRAVAPSGPVTPATERFLDPVRGGQVLPLFVADADTSPWDGKVITAAKIDVGTGAANLSVVTREVLEKSTTDFNTLTADYGVHESQVEMETVKGNKKAVTDPHWNRRQLVVGAWSAPLPKAA